MPAFTNLISVDMEKEKCTEVICIIEVDSF